MRDGLIEDLDTLRKSTKLLHSENKGLRKHQKLRDRELASAREEISQLMREIQRLGEERGWVGGEILMLEGELWFAPSEV